MHALLAALPHISALAQLDINGFFTSDTFLVALADLISALVLQILNLLFFGGATAG
ncbi:MAG: hypothetical protein H6817_11105 [Phycisphaerales bacterium]|nr:hypothetical protein [Phycisphaerales bacterium]